MKHNLEEEIKTLLPMMKERHAEIETLRDKVDVLDWKLVGESDLYYPIRFFGDGLSAYVYAFDNASVYYAWAAVEHALLVRLGATTLKSAVTKKNGRYYPGEKRLVLLARQNGVLSRDKERVAHRLRKLRNDYIHYINIMCDQHNRDIGFRKFVNSHWPGVINEIHAVVPKDEQAIVLELLDYVRNETREDKTIQKRQIPFIPDDPLISEVMAFRTRRLNQFAKWIRETDDIREQTKRFQYGIERRDALDCLKWSGELLIYLKFLSK